MAAGWGTPLDHAVLRGTLWAVGSCFHGTTASTVEVSVLVTCASGQNALRLIGLSSNCLSWVLYSDDIDDWDVDVFPKPSVVQNDLYANNEEEEDDGEYSEGRRVMVRH